MTRPNGMSFVLLLLAVGAGGYWLGERQAPEPEPVEPTAQTLLANGQTVVMAVRQLAQLQTVSFHMERLIDLKQRQSRLFGLVQADDAILLAAAGDVIAGVDLSALSVDAVQVDAARRRAVVTLPAPTLLTTRLDNTRTYVYRRKTELLAAREEGLETRARELAEQELSRAALAAGILDAAESGADVALRGLLMELGFTEIDVRFSHNERTHQALGN